MTDDKKLKLPALDPKSVETKVGTNYPEAFAENVSQRERRYLGDALGLTQFGVNLTRLPPGVMSAQRHWHSHEDEFVMVAEGELVLITDGGEQILGPGMTAGFPAGITDGHHLINRTDKDATYLEVGSRNPDDGADYPGLDLLFRHVNGKPTFTHADGTPYEETEK
ncbi:MAG: cupin domain-containing protein [Rhodospirillales bacterium]|nr:cupin domain-containing protein [Rhodospirillales bacterium]